MLFGAARPPPSVVPALGYHGPHTFQRGPGDSEDEINASLLWGHEYLTRRRGELSALGADQSRWRSSSGAKRPAAAFVLGLLGELGIEAE